MEEYSLTVLLLFIMINIPSSLANYCGQRNGAPPKITVPWIARFMKGSEMCFSVLVRHDEEGYLVITTSDCVQSLEKDCTKAKSNCYVVLGEQTRQERLIGLEFVISGKFGAVMWASGRHETDVTHDATIVDPALISDEQIQPICIPGPGTAPDGVLGQTGYTFDWTQQLTAMERQGAIVDDMPCTTHPDYNQESMFCVSVTLDDSARGSPYYGQSNAGYTLWGIYAFPIPATDGAIPIKRNTLFSRKASCSYQIPSQYHVYHRVDQSLIDLTTATYSPKEKIASSGWFSGKSGSKVKRTKGTRWSYTDRL